MSLRSMLPAFRRSQDLATGRDPFSSLHREMDRLFDDFFRGFGGTPAFAGLDGGHSPSLEVKETEQGLEVCAELPGVDEKDVEIALADGTLTIKGEKKSTSEKGEGDYRVSERRYGAFTRQVALPFEVDEEKASAELRNGVLKVSLPRSASAQPPVRKIEIKSAA